MIELDEYQAAFMDAVKILARGGRVDGSPHLVLRSAAGSGKTFSITQALQYIPRNHRVIVLMFGKRNATDIKAKLPEGGNIEARTTHSLGGRELRRNHGGVLKEEKTAAILRDMQMSTRERKMFPELLKLVSVAKAVGLVPIDVPDAFGLVDDTPEDWAGLVDHFTIEFDEQWQEERAIEIARAALRLSFLYEAPNGCFDFDDMLYLPVVLRMPFRRKYQWVFIDEAQDINAVQREMVKRVLAPGGHLIAVGDPNQAIYGFRGADSESMARIEEEMDAAVLPLSVCYRCDREIVKEAQGIVPEIEWHDKRGPGEVVFGLGPGSQQEKLARFTPDSVILCPRNAPLVAAAFGFIRKRIACHMVGRDFADGLLALLKKLEARTVLEAERKLEIFLEVELSRLENKENRRQTLEDRAATLRVFLEDAPANQSIEVVFRAISSLFDDNASGMLTLSSIHKAKGGEWPRVFLMDSELLKASTQSSLGSIRDLHPWEMQQRRNLLYVGITRAQQQLVYVTSDDMERLLQ